MGQETYRKERYIDAMIALGLALLAALLYLPFLGSYPLWDPWEAHYSQVAMEMVHNNSWWEPWYRKSTTSFWSKPILTFWLMVSSLKTFRINQVGSFVHAEFYLRLPIALMGATGVAFMFFFVRRMWNRRTGVLAALVLATCPQYFLISRQIMVDIPFVVIQLIALGFFALGLFDPRPETDDEQEVQFGVKLFRNLALIALALQILEWTYWRFRLLPNIDLGALLSFDKVGWAQEQVYWALTMKQGSYHWLAFALFFFLWMLVRTFVHTPKTRFFYLFFFFSGLGFLAKGLLSIVVPGGAVLFYILLTRDWDLLRRMRLVYNSEKLSNRSAITLTVVASVGAIWLITYPMMTGLLQIPLNSMSRSKSFKVLKRHESEHKMRAELAGIMPKLSALQLKQDAQMAAVQRHARSWRQGLPALRKSQARVDQLQRIYNSAYSDYRKLLKGKASAAQKKNGQARMNKANKALRAARSAHQKLQGPVYAHKRKLDQILAATRKKANAKRKGAHAAKAAATLAWVKLWSRRLHLESRIAQSTQARKKHNEALLSRSKVWRSLLLYNTLSTVQGYYRTFTQKRGGREIYHQVGWFTVFFLGFLLLALLIGGFPKWEGVKALLLTIPVFGLGMQSPLASNLGARPIHHGFLIFLAMTLVVFVLGKREKAEDFKRFFTTSGIFLALAWLPMNAGKILTYLALSPPSNAAKLTRYQAVVKSQVFTALVLLAIFTLLFAACAALVAYRFDRHTKEAFAPFKRQITIAYAAMMGTGLFFAFRVEQIQKYKMYVTAQSQKLTGIHFGPEILMMLMAVVSLVVLAVLFRGEEGQERIKAYFFSGALIYLIVAGSWVYIMDLKHGLRFMREWFIYHHFQRLQGVIEKPNNSFDLYIKQIGFGMFPWSALIPIALVRLLRWNWKDLLDERSRRNLFFFCCFFFPYVFFTFSSTKFHHYIFPVVPFLAVIIGVWLSRLFREDGVAKDRLGVGASLLLFALLAKDLMTNYKPLHQLFTYYTDRATPAEVYPRSEFLVIFLLFGVLFLSILLVRKVRMVQFGLLMIPVCLFVLYVNVRLVPAVAPNFSFKSLWTTFQKIDDKRILKDLRVKRAGALQAVSQKDLRSALDDAFQNAAHEVTRNRTMQRICRSFHRRAKENARRLLRGQDKTSREKSMKALQKAISSHDPCKVLVRRPFGEYANWDERSTSFYSNNFNQHIGKSWKAKPFLRSHKAVFIMVDRYKLPTLRRLAKEQKRDIYIVARPNYKLWLVSTAPVKGSASLSQVVHNKRPDLSKCKKVNILFGDKARMVAVCLNKPQGYRRGDKVRVTFVFKCLKKMRQSWGVFIHADPVTWTRNRLNWDHLMADGLYPTTSWKPGQYVLDTVERVLPRNYPTHYTRLHIYMGLWRGNSRLPIKYANVYHDGQNRVRPITLKLIP